MRKLLCLLALLTFSVPLFAANPFVGTWKLDTAKTKYTKGSALRNAILVIEEQGGEGRVPMAATPILRRRARQRVRPGRPAASPTRLAYPKYRKQPHAK